MFPIRERACNELSKVIFVPQGGAYITLFVIYAVSGCKRTRIHGKPRHVCATQVTSSTTFYIVLPFRARVTNRVIPRRPPATDEESAFVVKNYKQIPPAPFHRQADVAQGSPFKPCGFQGLCPMPPSARPRKRNRCKEMDEPQGYNSNPALLSHQILLDKLYRLC